MNNLDLGVIQPSRLIKGDCIEVMKTFPDNSIDCIVTDPPYGLNFMGKSWDKALPPKESFIEMCRVLKHGALAFVMSSPRQDLMWRMGQLLEESGFSLKQSFMSWIFNVGFPKSYDIAKGIDSKLGIKNIIDTVPDRWNGMGGTYQFSQQPNKGTIPITAPASDLAKKWSGYKSVSGLKPALEVIFMIQKPLSEKTIVDNVLKWGTGAMNVDACRIPIQNEQIKSHLSDHDTMNIYGKYNDIFYEQNEKGRFPANIVVSDDALNDGRVSNSRYFDLDAWATHNGIIQVPKASSGERDEGLKGFEIPKENLQGLDTRGRILERKDGTKSLVDRFVPDNKRKNTHPCVKPAKLMAYLITLGCPKNGVVLDPFVGSGTTCVAAKRLGRKWIGIELNEEYYKIAVGRTEKANEPLDDWFNGEIQPLGINNY
jgi:site-specific DNA-methyltransferase (adenine-specific)